MSSFNMQLPDSITEEDLQNPKSINQIRNYLYQLNEQLQYVLQNLSYDDNITDLNIKNAAGETVFSVSQTGDIVMNARSLAIQGTSVDKSIEDLNSGLNTMNEEVALKLDAEQTAVFNALTNNGALQGIYMSNGQLYINATYLKSGIIRALQYNQPGDPFYVSAAGYMTLLGFANGVWTGECKMDGDYLTIREKGANGGVNIRKINTDGSDTEFYANYRAHSIYIHGRDDSYGEQALVANYNSLAVLIISCGQLYYSSMQQNSDRRLKENIQQIDKTISKELIMGTKPYEYNMKDDKEKKLRHGIVAQQLKRVLDKIGIKNHRFIGKKDKYYTVNYIEFIPNLINVAQDLYQEVEQLKKRVEKLEGEKNGTV